MSVFQQGCRRSEKAIAVAPLLLAVVAFFGGERAKFAQRSTWVPAPLYQKQCHFLQEDSVPERRDFGGVLGLLAKRPAQRGVPGPESISVDARLSFQQGQTGNSPPPQSPYASLCCGKYLQ